MLSLKGIRMKITCGCLIRRVFLRSPCLNTYHGLRSTRDVPNPVSSSPSSAWTELSSKTFHSALADIIFTGKTKGQFKLVLAGLVISIKYNEDYYFSNEHYAAVGGIPLAELNFLEKTLLALIDYQVHVEEEDYGKYLEELTGLAKDTNNEAAPMREEEPECKVDKMENVAQTLTW
eukprot:TRINITY_DN16403_c0_g1_i1.p1 TRINITY_DN16403_c0_g1~~TRINITY_DN16403_c0_g1_i1.p1  ORF type:complete len:176 (+),score=20.25 TRINITY_DN16403_c0_g1_i1:171-698(+)